MFFQKFPVRLLLVAVLLLASLLPVLAAATDVIPTALVVGEGIGALPQGDFWGDLIPQVTKLMVYALGITSFIVFSVAGIVYVTAFGNQERTKKATAMIVWGITGLAFAAAAYALVSGVLGLEF